MSWYSKSKTYGRDFLTLGKHALSWGARKLGKVHRYSSLANDFMNHKNTKLAMKDLATAFPAVTGYYKEARRIGHIAENYSKLSKDALHYGRDVLGHGRSILEGKHSIPRKKPSILRPQPKPEESSSSYSSSSGGDHFEAPEMGHLSTISW